MTDATARDVIARRLSRMRNFSRYREWTEPADEILSALLAAPESVRLDLARRLSPEGFSVVPDCAIDGG